MLAAGIQGGHLDVVGGRALGPRDHGLAVSGSGTGQQNPQTRGPAPGASLTQQRARQVSRWGGWGGCADHAGRPWGRGGGAPGRGWDSGFVRGKAGASLDVLGGGCRGQLTSREGHSASVGSRWAASGQGRRQERSRGAQARVCAPE